VKIANHRQGRILKTSLGEHRSEKEDGKRGKGGPAATPLKARGVAMEKAPQIKSCARVGGKASDSTLPKVH